MGFRTKLFVVSAVYMSAMFYAAEAGGGDVASRVWWASALPLTWLVASLLQWLSMRPRPTLGVAIGDVVQLARARPMVAGFYAIAAVVIETIMVADALGRPLLR